MLKQYDSTEKPTTSSFRFLQSLGECGPGTPPRRWLNTSEFCGLYRVSPWTARRWCKQGKLRFIRVPPGPRGQLRILDPQWIRIDPPVSPDPVEWACIFRQCEVAKLLGISPRGLRYKEVAGEAKYQLVGHRKSYSLSEVRRLLAQRRTGRKRVSRRERQLSLVEWAMWKLGSPT